MKIPKSLKPGDTIGLIGASGATPPEALTKAVEAVEKMGFKVIVGDSCFKRHGYLSGSDAVRANDVNGMFKNPRINGIFCIRGGYGATRILPMLDFEAISQNPKVFAGYSDITALHIAINQLCELVTYHTPMPSTELIKSEMDEYTLSSFMETIMETEAENYYLANPPTQEMKTLISGEATGQLVGGNLTLVAASLGTPYEIDVKGKILFLEEVDEYERSIDRMLTQLKLSGKLDEAEGILLGAWTNCGPQNPQHPEHSLRLQTIFEEILVPLNKPILMDIACGHCLPTMSLPLGRTITFDSQEQTIEVIG
ncbi:LD-carboxypeptidase [Lysinibacillus yapensis]|uniref:LD-carboxypeptidase n=1 Tax=Ureibacillus yapensis TaxID=2304605 RepID=A0A396S3V9_9BACL|nr:LD-carboxypeptidase [Lysinibacillus yapensis]RHW33388.1 LD-carboxypeptidase [Lysinibacillus yapensis]